MEKDTKPKWQSVTMWGGTVSLFAMFFGGVFGVDITPEDQSTLVKAIIGIVGAMGVVATYYGRIRAKKGLR